MKRATPILIAFFVISGCASTVKSTPSNNTVEQLKQDYEQCLKQHSDYPDLCYDKKEKLLQQQNQDIQKLEQYGS